MKPTIDMPAIGVAKSGFELGAAGPDGAVLSNRARSRTRLAALLAEQPGCVAAMEACATWHRRGRVAPAHGREDRLVPAACVKPFATRRKSDRADAEAVAGAAMRPTMRLKAAKSAETQARAVASGAHRRLVRQRRQVIDALRGHPAEFGGVAPKGPASLRALEGALDNEMIDLPGPVREMGAVALQQSAPPS